MKKLSVVFLSVMLLFCGCGASEQTTENNHELLTWTVPGVVSYYLPEDSKLLEGWTMWESERTYWVDTENLTHTYLDMRYDELGTSGKTIAKAYEVQDNYTMEEIEHEYFTHHFVGETMRSIMKFIRSQMQIIRFPGRLIGLRFAFTLTRRCTANCRKN